MKLKKGITAKLHMDSKGKLVILNVGGASKVAHLLKPPKGGCETI